MTRTDDLRRIQRALESARVALRDFTPGAVEARMKDGDDPVTDADLRVDSLLKDELPRDGEAWLSEESVDDRQRLSRSRCWVVDPIDGTKEFVAGLPEWCVSIGLVEDGRAVAGGILNPVTDELVLGALGHGVTLNGSAVTASARASLSGALVLASRSEVGRGEWEGAEHRGVRVRAIGSVAYKLALVASGQADATWTLVPKNEWDVAAGVALVEAAGGRAFLPDGAELLFNRSEPSIPGLVATSAPMAEAVRDLIG